MTYKTDLVVLRSIDVKEHDRVYTVFSREKGKMCLLGIGTKRLKARLASGLEPLTRSEVFLVGGRQLDRAKGIVIDNQYKNLRENFELLLEAKKTAWIFSQISPEKEPNLEMYDSFCRYLEKMDEIAKGGKSDSRGVAKMIQVAFLWKLIGWSGHEPQLNECAVCHERLAKKRDFLMDFPTGVICGDCGNSRRGELAKISLNGLKALKFFVDKDYEVSIKLKLGNELEELVLATRVVLGYILNGRTIF